MLALGLQDLLVFLLAAGLVVPAARRARVNPVLGFLLVGIIVGPFGLITLADKLPILSHVAIANVEAAGGLAELGVVFLLFMIALELPLDRLIEMRRLVFGAGFLQIFVTTLAIGVVAWAFGNSLAAATLIGGALALSSTAIVSAHLLEQREMATPTGQLGFGVLLAQDLAVVPLLFLLGSLSGVAVDTTAAEAAADNGSQSVALSFALAMLQALVAIAVIVFVGRLVIRPLFRLVGREYQSDVFMATTLLVITITAWLTHAAGMSAALGAFLAGLLLAETEYRHEIELLIEPLKGLLLALFFISVGMQIDLAQIASEPLWIAVSVVGLLGLKATLMFSVARVFGYSLGNSVRSGLQLAQGGEFAFVIIGGAAAAGVIAGAVGQFMLIVVSATMVATPFLLRLAPRIGAWLDGTHEVTEPDADLAQREGHVVLIGFGRTGKLLAELLEEHGRHWSGLDLDAVRVVAEQRAGQPLYLGDASRRAMLEKVGIGQAAAVVICTDDPRYSERILRSVRDCSPSIPVLMRVHGSLEGREFLDLGATLAVPEVLESGLQLATSLLDRLGVSEADSAQAIARRRTTEGIRR